jgi:arginyl-tRNA synthetase
MSLLHDLTHIFEEAFTALDLPKELGQVRVSDRPEMAQFQCNGAMPAAKQAKKNPREIAGAIIDHVAQNPLIRSVEVAGPGFINIHVKDDILAQHVQDLSLPDLGEGQTVILDYGGPNIAKPMHVGHLRSSIIGDTLRRMLVAANYNALGDIHLGDWGTHLGILFNDYVEKGEESLVLDTNLDDEESVSRLFQDMSNRYPAASAVAKDNPVKKEAARETTVKLQNKEEPYYQMFQIIREVSFKGMRWNFAALNVLFDLWKGESDVHDLIAPMAEKLKESGHAISDDGALVVPVAREDDKMEVPPLILYKRDGAVMYGTTDLATLVERMDLYSPSRILYIVDQRQYLHFEQLFRAAYSSGIVPEDTELLFAGFGTMNGTDGKPFKTRAGGVMRLEDLIIMAREKALERINEADLAKDMDESERSEIARMIGIAALKFADLQNQRQSDYIFDLDRMTNFEGKTGPYLLYQAVRIKSLLRKAGIEDPAILKNAALQIDDVDRSLVLLLSHLPDVFALALKNLAPHTICDYLFNVAQEFSSFYANCHILSEEDEATRTSRLAVCAHTLHVMETILDLLGIEIPDRM